MPFNVFDEQVQCGRVLYVSMSGQHASGSHLGCEKTARLASHSLLMHCILGIHLERRRYSKVV